MLYIPYNSFPIKRLSHEDTVTTYPATMRTLDFVTAVNLTVSHTLENKAIGRILSNSEKTPQWLNTEEAASDGTAREGTQQVKMFFPKGIQSSSKFLLLPDHL